MRIRQSFALAKGLPLIIGLSLIMNALSVCAQDENVPPFLDERRGEESPRGQGREDFRRGRTDGEGEQHRPLPGFERVRQWVDELRVTDPEEYGRLMRLREENPERFHGEIRQLMRERLQERRKKDDSPRNEEDAEELARQYRAATEPAEKAELKKQLETTLEATFARRQEQHRQMVRRLEQHLAKLREQLELRERQKDAIIKKRVEELTSGKAE